MVIIQIMDTIFYEAETRKVFILFSLYWRTMLTQRKASTKTLRGNTTRIPTSKHQNPETFPDKEHLFSFPRDHKVVGKRHDYPNTMDESSQSSKG